MELIFEKIGNRYIAEVKVTQDFNLHIEKNNGSLNVYQSSIEGGNYDIIKTENNYHDSIIDIDFVGAVYPKWIKVETSVLPTLAVLSSSGESENVNMNSIINTPV